MTLHNYVELNIYDSEGRPEFPRKRIPEDMSYRDMEKFALEFAREWFTSVVVIEDAAMKFERENGKSLNLPKRRIISTNVMEDHYDAPRCIWQKRFDQVN
jgi:hypothetical protein